MIEVQREHDNWVLFRTDGKSLFPEEGVATMLFDSEDKALLALARALEGKSLWEILK